MTLFRFSRIGGTALGLIALLSVSCYSGNSTFDSPIDPDLTTDPAYPHVKNWAFPEKHGDFLKVVKDFDTTTCLKCHTGESEEGAPACGSCHSNYPHAAGWSAPDQHGFFAASQGTGTCATKCHGDDLAGGLSGVSCTTCHTIYPHSDNWSAKEEHGIEVIEKGVASCITCHGDSEEKPTQIPTCQSCHSNYPHPEDWKKQSAHGQFALDNGTSTCTGCHGEDFKGGETKVSCYSCHTTYPHPDNWLSEATHANAAVDDGFASCFKCHSSDPEDDSPATPCASCHDESLTAHTTEGWAVSGHNQYLADTGKSADTTCANCHGEKIKLTDKSIGVPPEQSDITTTGGLTVPTCYSCHASYPHDTMTTQYGEMPWFDGHIVALLAWQKLQSETDHTFVQKSCFMEGSGCHAILSPPTVKLSVNNVIELCDSCHPIK